MHWISRIAYLGTFLGVLFLNNSFAQVSITNVGLAPETAGFDFFDAQGNLVAFLVLEGGTDLNGDGDGDDFVLHVFDASSGTTTNVGLDSNNPQLQGNLVAFSSGERQGIGGIRSRPVRLTGKVILADGPRPSRGPRKAVLRQMCGMKSEITDCS